MRHNILAIAIITAFACGCPSRDETPTAPDAERLSEVSPELSEAGDPIAVQDWPTGHSTPEGVACDLARAFINRNAELFLETCIPKFGNGESAAKYEDFLTSTSSSIRAESKKVSTTPSGPARITTVFVARHLTKNGPASYGYATHNFHDVMFVDLDVELHNGKTMSNRTLVLKTSEGNWYVHPDPSAHALLSDGLNDETVSKVEFEFKPGATAQNGG